MIGKFLINVRKEMRELIRVNRVKITGFEEKYPNLRIFLSEDDKIE